MSTTAAARQPSPELIFETMNAYQQTAALRAAIELDLFTAIGEGCHTAHELARRCNAADRGVRILADYMTIHGFLTKSGKEYSLTPDSAMFLDRRSPACMANAYRFLNAPLFMENYMNFTAAVRKGGAPDNTGTLAPEDPLWVEFAHSMAPLMHLPAQGIAQLVGADAGKKCRVLDIAAGHGKFGIAIAQRNPQAEIVAVDWPNVLEVAKENAEAAGVAARYKTLPGRAFDVSFPSDCDIVLLTNFLHHFDPPTNEELLRKVHAALAEGGRAVTVEFVPNEDRITPPTPAAFSLVMLGSTPSGDAYTFAEYQQMFRNAGYRSTELHALPPTFMSALIAVK